MELRKASESLKAAELCFSRRLFNAAANQACTAMLQAAVVALERGGIEPKNDPWSNEQVQSAFANELTRRRKTYPMQLAWYLLNGLTIRAQSDYEDAYVTEAQAKRMLTWTREFLKHVEGGHDEQN